MPNALSPKPNALAPKGNALMRAYEPGIMDNARWYAMNALAPLFGGDVRAANAYVRDKVQPTAEFLPGVGDAMAAGEAADEFKQGNYGTGTLLGIAAAAGLVPGVGDVAQKGIKQGIRAYHGSPHDFDKFSMENIGTGEGAQAYGHGLYFAENEGVARDYRDALSDPDNFPLRINDQPLDTVWNDELRRRFPDMYQGLSEDAASDMDTLLGTLQGVTNVDQAKNVASSALERQHERLFNSRVLPKLEEANVGPGRMYEVNINANPEDFLDWDKPLSEQPSATDAMASAGFNTSDQNVKPSFFGFKNEENVNKLREAGIPGIKYLDQGSRGAGDGTRNYVVFDDKMIDILRKYGLAGLALSGGGNALLGQYAQPTQEQY